MNEAGISVFVVIDMQTGFYFGLDILINVGFLILFLCFYY